jgi:hypothetical protein
MFDCLILSRYSSVRRAADGAPMSGPIGMSQVGLRINTCHIDSCHSGSLISVPFWQRERLAMKLVPPNDRKILPPIDSSLVTRMTEIQKLGEKVRLAEAAARRLKH